MNTQCSDNRVTTESVVPSFCTQSSVNVSQLNEYKVNALKLRQFATTIARRVVKDVPSLKKIADRQVAQAETSYKKALS